MKSKKPIWKTALNFMIILVISYISGIDEQIWRAVVVMALCYLLYNQAGSTNEMRN